MARSFGSIDCGIWDDPDFCLLSAGAQRTYLMLITQRDITACGSLPLTLRRWSATCGEKDIEAWIAELTDANFVLIDEDTEELLVRTFAKWDGGYRHTKRRMAVISTARAIKSVTLRSTASTELAKLGVSISDDKPSDTQPDGNSEAIRSGRFPVQVSDHNGEPETGNLETGAIAADADEPLSMFCSKHPNGTEKACGPCQTARLRYAAAAKSKLAAELAAKADRARAIAACNRCDDQGLELHPDTKLILGRCTHAASGVVAS